MSTDPTPAPRDRDALRTPAAGERRRGFRWSVAAPLIGILAIVVALAVAFGSGIMSPAVPNEPPVAETTPEPAASEVAPPAATRDDPAPAGTALEIATDGGPLYTLTFGTPVLEASDIVRAATRYYREADAGFQYLMVPATFTYRGPTSGTPRSDLRFGFLSAAGTVHEGTSSAVLVPKPIADIVKLQPNTSSTGNIVIMVPSADVASGSLIVTAPDGTEFVVAIA